MIIVGVTGLLLPLMPGWIFIITGWLLIKPKEVVI
jgi:uncharacterized membrane protein YbaN (DUF454 family)